MRVLGGRAFVAPPYAHMYGLRGLSTSTATTPSTRESHEAALAQTGWRQAMLRASGYYSSSSSQIRCGKIMMEACSNCADSAAVREACDLEDSFKARFDIMVLHIWLCMVRLRAEGEWGETVQQILYDQWLEDMEQKLVLQEFGWLEISNFTKEFQRNFFSSAQSYDQALTNESDAVLAGALYRHLFGGEESSVSAVTLARAVGYLRQKQAGMDALDIREGRTSFDNIK